MARMLVKPARAEEFDDPKAEPISCEDWGLPLALADDVHESFDKWTRRADSCIKARAGAHGGAAARGAEPRFVIKPVIAPKAGEADLDLVYGSGAAADWGVLATLLRHAFIHVVKSRPPAGLADLQRRLDRHLQAMSRRGRSGPDKLLQQFLGITLENIIAQTIMGSYKVALSIADRAQHAARTKSKKRFHEWIAKGLTGGCPQLHKWSGAQGRPSQLATAMVVSGVEITAPLDTIEARAEVWEKLWARGSADLAYIDKGLESFR